VVFGGLASILVLQASDLASLGLVLGRRVASDGFLRLATLALAQALDLVTFQIMVTAHGATAEANPIVSDLFVTHGFFAVVMGKVALVILIGALSVAGMANGRRGVWAVVGGLPLALAIAAGIVGGITNTANLLG
jgi:hypothetical protein